MDLMTIVFGYFVFKSIFKDTKNCDFTNDYYDYDDYDDYDDCDCGCDDYVCDDYDYDF